MGRPEEYLQKLLEKECSKPNSNSILLSVRSGDGRVRFEGTAGEGTTASPYFVASISKMFTATVIMQLVDEGRLGLNDPIDKYLFHLPLDGIRRLVIEFHPDRLQPRETKAITARLLAEGFAEDGPERGHVRSFARS